jgi:phospholipid/cholesterol/gamma-HCH transport system ATP-binding protein
VSHTTSLLVTHRLQDAFVLATHRFEPDKGMVQLPKEGPDHGINEATKFLMLNEGGIVFHGTTDELVHSKDPWIQEYLS